MISYTRIYGKATLVNTKHKMAINNNYVIVVIDQHKTDILTITKKLQIHIAPSLSSWRQGESG